MRNNERQGLENLRRVIKVERRGSRGDKTYEETAYYISSLTECSRDKRAGNKPNMLKTARETQPEKTPEKDDI